MSKIGWEISRYIPIADLVAIVFSFLKPRGIHEYPHTTLFPSKADHHTKYGEYHPQLINWFCSGMSADIYSVVCLFVHSWKIEYEIINGSELAILTKIREYIARQSHDMLTYHTSSIEINWMTIDEKTFDNKIKTASLLYVSESGFPNGYVSIALGCSVQQTVGIYMIDVQGNHNLEAKIRALSTFRPYIDDPLPENWE